MTDTSTDQPPLEEQPTLVADATAWAKSKMDSHAGHDWGHIDRVITNAHRLAQREQADLLVVRLAAIMHDIVNLSKDDPERHRASRLSADLAAQWLKDRLSPQRTALVCEAIKCHSFSAGFTPKSLEAMVVSDADNLDAIGAIGIARTFEVGAALGAATVCPVDPLCRQREPDDSRYSVDHFFTKLLKLKDRFYTATGRQEAQQRIQYMREFLDQLKREVTAPDTA